MKNDTNTKGRTSDCSVTINIETSGNINIYNCGQGQQDKDCRCKDEPKPDSTGGAVSGACVPASLGAKPKQSRKTKLDRLLNSHSVPSAFAASFFHTSKRFIAGKTAGNELETLMFSRFQSLSPEMKRIMKCTTESFDSLSTAQKGLFAGNLLQDMNSPVSADQLATEFEKELTAIVSGLALGNAAAALTERPGKVRLYQYGTGDDVYPAQVHVFKINELRTNDQIPYMNKQDYQPEEFQQICTPAVNGETVEWNCSMQQPPCDGNQLDDVCMRVPQVQSGGSVTLEGVNFFDIDAKVQYNLRGSADPAREVDAFVYGDIDTPVKEIVEGTERLINDKRVHDKIFFTIPQDIPPGIYEIRVAVPNSSGFSGPGFGDDLMSNGQFIEVLPPPTTRFQIASERLFARRETSPQSFGSDEIGIKVNTIPVFADMSLGEMQQHSFRFGDVDSGESRQMDGVLFTHSQPVLGAILSLIGYEIDGEEAYKNQITEWTDVFYEILKDQWAYIFANSVIAQQILSRLTSLGFWGYVIIAIGVAITLLVDLFVAIWAPADLVIQDTLGYSVTDLVRMTDINIPAPTADSNLTLYTTAGDIQVRLMQSAKIQNQYSEERGYLSEGEDSWYNVRLRFNRTA